ncbi:MAG: hypothetical protein ACI4XF_07690, partial [Oscillospiraceae bacterium]
KSPIMFLYSHQMAIIRRLKGAIMIILSLWKTRKIYACSEIRGQGVDKNAIPSQKTSGLSPKVMAIMYHVYYTAF